MKGISNTYLYILIMAVLPVIALAKPHDEGRIGISGIGVHRVGDNVDVSADIVLDSMRLGANRQFFITPVIECGDRYAQPFPSVLVNGRNMHIAYERGTLKAPLRNYDVLKEVRRANGKPQTVKYAAQMPMQQWMLLDNAVVRFVVDTCGCGHVGGRSLTPPVAANLNPVSGMHITYITPAVTELPVSIHEGEARVQFEVNKTDLHVEPYVCRSGQRIDNTLQLAIINDSIDYALTNPNVEIASINICGYASPESPYMHNEYLATNRSRALAEYIGEKYSLPADRCTYGSVPENWAEFREIVVNAPDITQAQRADLLTLIDRPAYGASDYDEKERELKTSPKFAALYRDKILPQWFPLLRATKFAISTRLKPLSDRQLAVVINETPQLMSLNQMMRVARLYAEGSIEFDQAIATALQYYPDDETANLNAAVSAIKAKDYDRGAALLERAGSSAEAENARGVVATYRGDYDAALKHFEAAGDLPEAMRNASLLK